jgi:hypothetical protein
MARKIRSIDSRKAQTRRETWTGSRGTKTQTQVERAASIWAKHQRSTRSRNAGVTAGRFRHGTVGVSTLEAENQQAALSIRARR